MASVQDCEQALHTLAERVAGLDPEVVSKHGVDRTVSCAVPDLGVVFLAQAGPHGLHDLRCERADPPPSPAQVRLTARSDDLVALLQGRLSPAAAWATGRLRIEASVLDLLRLRALL